MTMKRIKLNPNRTQHLYQQQHASRYRKYRDELVDVNWCLPCDVRLVSVTGTVIPRGCSLHVLLTALRAVENSGRPEFLGQAVDDGRAVGSLRKLITSSEALRARE